MFFFGRKKKPAPKPIARRAPSGPSAAPKTGGEKRQTFRMPVAFDVRARLEGRPGRRHAMANDLSAGGLRLLCDEDFLLGSMLETDFRLPSDFLSEMSVEKEVYEQSPFGLRPETVKVQPPGFKPVRVRTKVMASFFDLDVKQFAHGLAFVGIDSQTQEELQRFIHLWQVHYLRVRRGED